MTATMRWLVALSLVLLSVAPARAEIALGYVQGHKIKIEVVDINGVEVEARTARAFTAMAEAAANDGVELELTSGFRTNERQAELYDEYVHDAGALAAKPGYSNHQSGRALDINCWNWSVYEWLTAHAARYGFKRTVPGEPWHWEYKRSRAARRGTASKHR
jgi:LAS superfamily LD-carboxypeptidase LdcB